MTQERHIAVLGGGSWATAIVKLLMNNVEQLYWYMRSEEQVAEINKFKHNPKYLSSVEIDTSKVLVTTDLGEIIEKSNFIIVVIPAPFLEKSLAEHSCSFKKKFVVSAVKGIVPKHNLTVSEFFNTHYEVPFSQIGIISGPCHAEEIALERLSYLTISSKHKADAKWLANMLSCHYLRTQVSTDIYGTEYAAVLKNIIAIAAGICHGLGYGDNFQAVLVSNAIQEIKRFLDKTYKSKRKIYKSAYLGDLLVTTYSQFSRNRTFGTMIGKGYSAKSAQLEMNMIAEGMYAVNCIKEINEEYKVNMPIVEAVHNILSQKISPALEIKLLTEKLR